MKSKSTFRNIAACAALGITLTLTAGAATVTKAPAGTDLTAGASWGGTAPTATDTATWTATSLGAGLTLGSPASWQGVAVTGATSNIDLSGAGALTLGNGGIDLALSTVDLALSTPVTLGANQIWKAAGGRTLTVSGSVGGTGDLAFGAAAPTANFNSGYVSASSSAPTTVFTNTTLANITAANGVMQGGWIPAATPAAGYYFTNNGTTATVQLQFYDGTHTKVAKVQLTQSGADVVAYQIYAKYKTGYYLGQNFDDPYAVTGLPPIGSGGYGVNGLTVSIGLPSNGTVALSGTNAYTGATTVNVGTLTLSGGDAIPDASAVSLSAGSTLLLNAGETIGSLAGAGSANIQSNTLTAGGNNSSTTYSGTLSGTGGALVKSGTGTLTLTGGNTYTGGTTVSQGTLVASTGNSLGTTGTLVMNDANTGANNTSLFAQVAATGDLVVPHPITIANQGSGTVTLGTNRTGAGRTFFNGEITLNRDLTLSSMLTDRTMYRGGIRGTGNLTITGGSRTTLSDVIAENDGEGTALYDFTGNVTLTTSGTVVQINSNMEFTNAGTVTVDTGATLRTAYGKTLGINALAGSGTVTSVAGSGTIIVGIANGGSTFSGVISGTGGDALKLTKAGSGTQTLTGTNTYTGATTINGGTLKLGTGGSINGTASITVAPGATFDATDTGFTLATGKTLTAGDTNPGNDVTGAIVSQGTVRPGGNGTLGTITGVTNLTLGGTLDWERSANSTASDGIAINGTLTISAGFSFNPLALGFPSAGNRSYTVVSGLTAPLTQTDIDNLPVPPAEYTWDTSDASALKITHVQTGSNLAWTGTASGNWDTSATNWTGVSGIYQEGDFCTFDDTATGTTTVDIPADVNPGGLLFNNSALNYTVGSSTDPKAGIGGSITLLKQGSGTLTLTSSNFHSGGTILTGGVLSFANGAIPPTGALTMDGGTLRWETGNTQDVSAVVAMMNGKTATFDTNGNDVAFATGIGSSSTAALVKSGAGKLALGGTGTWTGGVEVQQGTVAANTNGALGGNTVTLGATAQDTALILSNRADIPNAVTVSAAGTGAVVIGSDNTGSGLNAATITGTITLNRAATFSGGVLEDRLAIDGRVTGNAGTLTIAGGSRTTLLSTLNDFTGNIVVTGSGTVLQASVATAAGVIPDATNITIDAGAVVQTASNSGVETVGGINGGGELRSFKDANPGNLFGPSITIGGGDQSGDFSGVIANGNAVLNVTKTGTGTQILRGFSTYTGNTTVNAGTLDLKDDAALTFRITNTATNTLTGAGTVILDGNFAIDVSAVTATTGTWQLENADTLTGAYGSTFQVVTPAGAPWTDAGSDKWKTTSGTLEFTFDESNGTLTVQLAGFASWISKTEFGLAPADQDPTDDPDNDGVNNLVEYAIAGRNPAVSDGAPGSFTSGTLSFTKRTEAAADAKISYKIEESDDLGATDPWTEAPAGLDYTNNSTTISYTLPTGKAKTFARLVVTQAP
ncbi:MAG: autotransporter-associated beta strand repeat-containing protein [Verrucomicrobia bacterium]|nr:autotransporter-associated beta strand repeat-containing protein [Verrucomicrobiota bacterium]